MRANMNISYRFDAALDRAQKRIEERIDSGTVTQDDLDQLNRELDISVSELVKFQETKSIAMLHEKVTQDEATWLYRVLGEIPDTFNNQPLHVKVVVTQIIGELLTWRLSLA